MRTPDRFSANSDLLHTPEARRKPVDCVNTPTAVTPKTPSLEMRGISPNSESRHQRRIDAYASQHQNLARRQTGMEPGLNLNDFPSLESMEMPGVHFAENTNGSSLNAISRLDGLKQEIPTFGFNDLLVSLEMNLPVQEPRVDIQNFVMDNPIPSVNQLLPFSNNLPPRPINVELKNAQIMKTPVKDDTDNIDDSTMKDIPSLPSEKGTPVTCTEASNAMANNSVPIKPSQVNKSGDIIDPSIQKSSSQKENLQLITLTKSDKASTTKLCSKPTTSVTQPESVDPSSKDSSLMPSLVKNKHQNSAEAGIMTDQGSSKTTQFANQLKETDSESRNNSKQSPPSVSENQPQINEQTAAISMERNHQEVTNRNVQGPFVANTHHQYQHPSRHQYHHPSHHHQYQRHSQSHATNFPPQPTKPLQTINAPKRQFANQYEFPPYQYMHPHPSANAYFPTAVSYPPYSYNHTPYGASTYPFLYQSDGGFYPHYYQQGPGYFNGYINSYNRQFCANPYYSMQQVNQVTRSSNQKATNVPRFNGQQVTNVARFNGQHANNIARFNGQQVNLGLRSNAQSAIHGASLNGQQVKLGTNSNDQVARSNNQQANPRMRFNSCQGNQVAKLNDEHDNPVTRMNSQHSPYYSLNGIKRMKLPEAPTQVNKVTSSYLDHNKNRVEIQNSNPVQSIPNSDQRTNIDKLDPTPVQKDKLETDSSVLNGNPIKAELSSATTDAKSLTNAIKTEELPKMSRSNLTITNKTQSNLTQNCTKCTNLKARMHSIKKSRLNDLIFIIHDTDDDSCDDEVCTIETEELEDLAILCDDCGGVVEEEVKAETEIDDPENDNLAILNESITSPKSELDECFNTTQSDVESLQYIQPSEVSIFKLAPREEPKLTDFTAQNMKFLPQNSHSIFTPVETSENFEAPRVFEPEKKQKTRKGRKAKTETARGQTNRRRGPGRPKGSGTGTRVKKKIQQNTGKKCWNCFATKSSAWYTHRRQTKSHLCCSCYNYYKTRNEQNRKIEVLEQTSRVGPMVYQTSRGGPIILQTQGGPIVQPITRSGPIIQHLKKRVNDYEMPVNNGQYDVKPVIDRKHGDVTDIPVFLPQAKQNNSTLEVSLVESRQDSVKEALNEKEDDFDVHILNVHKQSNILNQSNQESLGTNDSGFSEDFFADLFDIDIKFINDVVDMNNKTEDGLDLDFFQNIDCSSLLNSGETLRVLEIKNDKPQKTTDIKGSQSNQTEINKKSANIKPKANQRKKSSKRSKRKEKSVVPLNVGTVTVKTVDVKPEGETPVFSYSFTLPNDL